MAITTAFCDQAKLGFLSGTHQSGHTYKIALIKSGNSGTWNSGTYSYSQLLGDEVANGSGYTTGGATLAGYTVALTTNTGSIDWTDPSWTTSTISADGAMIYNASIASSQSLAVFSFGSTVSSNNGTFSITIPTAGVGVIRIA